MNGLTEIKSDLFDVSKRLKSVNPSYRLYYNNIRSRFEVYDGRTKALAFVVPYDRLDARTVKYARYTSVQNAEKVFSDMEKHNAELKKAEASKSVEKVLGKLENSL